MWAAQEESVRRGEGRVEKRTGGGRGKRQEETGGQGKGEGNVELGRKEKSERRQGKQAVFNPEISKNKIFAFT